MPRTITEMGLCSTKRAKMMPNMVASSGQCAAQVSPVPRDGLRVHLERAGSGMWIGFWGFCRLGCSCRVLPGGLDDDGGTGRYIYTWQLAAYHVLPHCAAAVHPCGARPAGREPRLVARASPAGQSAAHRALCRSPARLERRSVPGGVGTDLRRGRVRQAYRRALQWPTGRGF